MNARSGIDWLDWLQLCALALEMLGMGLVLMEVYRADLTRSFAGRLGRLPDTIQALRPKDTPIWLPFWLVFGPVAAYFIYLPLDDYKVFRVQGLFGSLALFALLNHRRGTSWWHGQPLAYLLLAPFALPNQLLVYVLDRLIGSLRWMLGSVQDRVLLHIGMILAAAGFLIDMVQTFLLFV